MLLAIDAGNTNITIGLFRGPDVAARWRLRTVQGQTCDELGLQLRQLLALEGFDPASVSGVIVSSVVPPLDAALATMAEHYFGRQAFFVNGETETGLTLRLDNPREVGADRVVNAVAALAKYGGPCIVVDLGTAITFDAVSARAEYLGGAICPGIGIAINGLFHKAARLPMVAFTRPAKLIGTDTIGSMQSGLFYGVIGMIDGILERMIAEMGPETKTVATGGQAGLVAGAARLVTTADEDLTLEGLRLVWERNRRP
jgi:type III pantothenate kinase